MEILFDKDFNVSVLYNTVSDTEQKIVDTKEVPIEGEEEPVEGEGEPVEGEGEPVEGEGEPVEGEGEPVEGEEMPIEGEGMDMGMMGEGMEGETSVKDPLLSSWTPIIGISAATLIIGVVIGILLAKRKIKKGIELYED